MNRNTLVITEKTSSNTFFTFLHLLQSLEFDRFLFLLHLIVHHLTSLISRGVHFTVKGERGISQFHFYIYFITFGFGANTFSTEKM